MRNFGDAQAAVETALNSNNSAIEENARYMESITAKLNALKSEYEKFILGDGGLEAFEKKMLDSGLAVMQFINDIGGLSTVMSALGTVLAVALVGNFDKLYKSFDSATSSIFKLVGGFIEARHDGLSFADSLKMIGVSASTTQIALQGMVAVIGIAVTLFNVYQQKQKELADSAHEASEAALSQCDSINLQLSALKKENQSREDLVKAIQAVDGAYKDEGQRLDEINKKRQETIDKLKEEGQVALKNAEDSGYTQYIKDRKSLQSSGVAGGTIDKYSQIARGYGIDFDSSTMERTLDSLKKVREAMHDNQVTTQSLDNVITKLQEKYDKARQGVDAYDQVLLAEGKIFDVVTNKIRALIPSEVAQEDAMNGATEATEQQKGALEDLGYTTEQLEGILNEADFDKLLNLLEIKDIDGVIALLQSYGLEVNNINNATQEGENIWDKYLDNIENVQSAYETLMKAAEEYNKNGFITASTLKKLNKLEPEYLALLYKEGDAYTNIKEGLDKYLDKEKADAKAKVEIARLTTLLEIAQNALKDATSDSEQAVDDFATAASDATDDVSKLKNLTAQLAITMGAVRNQGKVDDNLVNQLKNANEYFDGLAENIDNVFLGIEDSAKSSSKSTKDAWVEAFEEEQRQLKHSLEMNEITEIEYYEKLKELNEKYFGEVSGNHQKYLKEYQENEEEIYKGLKAVYDKVKDYLKEAVEQGYEKAINAIKKEEKKLLAEIKSQIEALKKEKKHVLDGIKDQVNALKKEKEAVQKYYNDQIDALKRENEEIEKQNELLEYQQALQQAKSKKVMVYQEGKFQLTEDESAVAQAEQNLAQYENKAAYEKQIQELEDLRDATVESLEERIQALEDYYDYMEDYYDRQIDSMEEYYNQVQEQYEKQIEALQTELDTFKEGYQKAEDLENAKLAATVLAANEEASVWQKRLENLATAVSEYNRILDMIGEGNVQSTFAAKAIVSQASNKISEVESSIGRRASGDASFKGDEIALVGESPNAELILGSHINHSLGGGSLMNLSKGSGIVNAESTSTLAGLLNGLASPTSVSNSRSVQQNFTFGNISLPNVTDGNSFVKALSTQFNNYAIQYGNTTRR